MYSRCAAGNTLTGSTPDFFMKGLRSTKAWEVQNSPTLSVVNDDTTSGALGPPARRAWLILSSVMLPTAFTCTLGYFFSNPSIVAWMAATSLGADQPCQNVIVTSAFGLSLAPPLDDPKHPVTERARAVSAPPAASRRVRRLGVVIVTSW